MLLAMLSKIDRLAALNENHVADHPRGHDLSNKFLVLDLPRLDLSNSADNRLRIERVGHFFSMERTTHGIGCIARIIRFAGGKEVCVVELDTRFS